MKKIIFVISQLYKGGAETSLVNLLNQLDYTRYSVDLLILNQSPVKDAVSLVDRINKKVTVCDAYKVYQNININDRVRAKLMYSMNQKGAYYFTALDFVRNKEYDWAFFVGEWCSPSFVACEVKSKIKAAWIHNDLSKAEYFDPEHYFYFSDKFDYFIFVSKQSMISSVEEYPFIKHKALTIYNINDVEYIKKRSKESTDYTINHKNMVLLTCANFRLQKNHLRQVQVMNELKKRGIELTWVNIGATSDDKLVEEVKSYIKLKGLEDNFLILGPKENPYSYMREADAITVLSDYESWSMVITEAKILGKTVISTRTSGAIEQIEDKKTGILTDFTVQGISDKVEELFKDKKLQDKIKGNVNNFDNTSEIVESFDRLIKEGKPYKENQDILYIIDDINYMGGAHVATKLQIKEFLSMGKKIAIYSSVIPNIKVRQELPRVTFLSFCDFREDVLLNTRLINCLFNRQYNNFDKIRKIKYTMLSYLKKFKYETMVLPHLADLFSKYNSICVMSEGSNYREVVANSICKNKIQWIHVDYCEWIKKNNWVKELTINDGEIYKKYNTIVVLAENIKKKFVELYPHLSDKVVVNSNLMPINEIKRKSNDFIIKNEIPVNFITVGRIDFIKAYPRLIKILSNLKLKGYRFHWTIVGDGDEFDYIKKLITKYDLEKEVIMKGALDNPFQEVKKADVFALLSDSEGLPNTIYEALILGVPVLATRVGGIPTQITDDKNGWLVENNLRSIEKKLESLLLDRDSIIKVKENLKLYSYDNTKIMLLNKKIFKINE